MPGSLQHNIKIQWLTYNDEEDFDLQVDETDVADAHDDEEQLHDNGESSYSYHEPRRAVRVRRDEAGVRLVHGRPQASVARHVADGDSCRYQRREGSHLSREKIAFYLDFCCA